MPITVIGRLACAAGTLTLLSFFPSQLSAQSRPVSPALVLADSSPARILAGPHVPVGVAVDVLRQVHRPYANAKRAELADALVARAISDPISGDEAVRAIATGGSTDPAMPGTPDAGAFDRLVQIDRASHSGVVRRAVAQGLVGIGPSRALPYLRDVAESSDDDAADYALHVIGRIASSKAARITSSDRAAAQTILKDLSENDLVKAPDAAQTLCEWAINEHWPKNHRCQARP